MNPVKTLLAGEVRAIFADPAGRKVEIDRSDDGLFGPGSVAWRVHGDVACMMIGGISALLLQMLHPAALAGIWDHSNFRRDMAGRLRRTAAFIAVTTYGSRAQAEAAIVRVRRIHGHVEGLLPDGAPYHANDPELLAWVHVAEATSFLGAFRRYREPAMSDADADRYFAEMAAVAEPLGVIAAPRSRRDAAATLRRFAPELRRDARTREAATLLLDQPAPSPALAPFQAVAVQAAVDLLPDWARRLHRLPMPATRRPLVRAGGVAMARMTRWAMTSASGTPARS